MMSQQSIFNFMQQDIFINDDPIGLDGMLNQMKKNFRTGKTKSSQFRRQALDMLIRGCEEMKEEINEAHKKDLGWNSFITEVATTGTTLGEIRDLKNNFKSWMKGQSIPTTLSLGLASCKVTPEPLGVALVLSAWNYPIYTALPQVAAAICAGNSVVLKPSEVSANCSKVLVKLFDRFLDRDFYRCIEGKVEVAKAITKLPFDIICFTGSTFTGRLVAIQAAKNLTPCILQLGGKCPVIVDETAKLQSAVLRILMGKYMNCGQTCIGVDHVYIHQSVYEKFKSILLEKIETGYGNHQDFQDFDYGKIISRARINRLEELLKDNHEGKILYGGNMNKQKRYISPTIVEKPKKTSLMMCQQIFGPIMPIFSYQNLSDVIEEINDRPKPLSVYLFSESSKNIKLVESETYSGAFLVNEALMQMTNCHLPFGGVGQSGYGRYHGKSGFDAFSNMKSIIHTKAVNPFPLSCRFPPYTEKKKKILIQSMKSAHLTYGQIGKLLFTVVLVIVISLLIWLVLIPALK